MLKLMNLKTIDIDELTNKSSKTSVFSKENNKIRGRPGKSKKISRFCNPCLLMVMLN